MRATGPYNIGALAGKAATGVRAARIAFAALALLLGARGAYADAGPETDNALATLCGIVEASAKTEGLPVAFFTKLIWRESSFRPTAVSPAGAQGVAQFMPGTASERGLVDPFDPASAIPASAKFLGELKRRFGNLGLAAAAYNAGQTAVGNWLAGKGSLPFETQDYVLAITGRDAEDWRSDKPAVSKPAGAPPARPAASRLHFARHRFARDGATCVDLTARRGRARSGASRLHFARHRAARFYTSRGFARHWPIVPQPDREPAHDHGGVPRGFGLVRALGRADRRQFLERLGFARLRPRPA